MNTQTPAKAAPTKPKQKAKPVGPSALKGSLEARRHAALILEVLCGERSSGDAAKAMGIALPRYYLLETRAMQGVVDALEPLPRGPRKSADTEIAALNRQITRQKQELAGAQFRQRTAQRVLGIPAPETREPKTLPSGKLRKPKRPSVRALKMVAALRTGQPSVPQAQVEASPSI